MGIFEVPLHSVRLNIETAPKAEWQRTNIFELYFWPASEQGARQQQERICFALTHAMLAGSPDINSSTTRAACTSYQWRLAPLLATQENHVS